MVNRLSVAVLATAAALAGIAGPASAAQPDTRVAFSGEFAGAAVTNCGTAPAPGTRCTTIFVSAGENRIHENGTKVRSEAVFVSVFVVLITGPGPFDMVGTQLGSADTTIADVNITGSLRSASASVEDLSVGGLRLDMQVTWTGVGDLNRSRTRETFDEGGTTLRFGEDSRSRDADATAVVNGETFSEFEAFGPVSFLGRSKSIEVCRGDCTFGRAP